MIFSSKFSSVLALGAAMSMAAPPVAAVEMQAPAAPAPVSGHVGWDADADTAENHRYRRYRHNRGIDAGDVIAGVLILGGIAAVANAANKSRDDRRYPRSDPRYRTDYPRDYRSQRYDNRYDRGDGIDRAVDMCMREIERDRRVESVDSVDRTGQGWRVTGRIYNGDGFACMIGNDGRIGDVTYGGRTAARVEDRQWDDERYAQARRRADANGYPATTQPAYPGGPVDGDYEYAYDEDGDLGG